MRRKGSIIVYVLVFFLLSCNYKTNKEREIEQAITETIECKLHYPDYYYWDTLYDSTKWIPFKYLRYRGMRLDSIKKLIGEPDFVSGSKMSYGLDKDGWQGCDIAPLFKDDSCAIVYEYIWQPNSGRRIQTVLFFELTHTHALVDTPLWGFKVDLDQVMLE